LPFYISAYTTLNELLAVFFIYNSDRSHWTWSLAITLMLGPIIQVNAKPLYDDDDDY